MKRLLFLLAAGCGTDDAWRHQRVVWEREPLIRRSEEIAPAVAPLRAKSHLTVEECWRLALVRSESLALTGEELVRLQTLYEQAVGALLPRVSFKASWVRQDDPGVIDEQRAEYKLFARQPIFTGLREYYALRQAGATFAAKEEELRQARLLIFGDVALAFYSALQARRDLDTVEESLKLGEERLEELVERRRLNISRRSEVLAQEADVAATKARVEFLKGTHAVAWEVLRFITGIEGTPTLDDTIAEPAMLPALAAVLEQAIARRPDLRTLENQLTAAREGRGIARAGYLPTVTLEGNYYTHREAIDIDWDVTLSLEIPIFDGGTTQAKLREASSLIRSAQLGISRLQRQILLDVRRTYIDVKSLQSQLASLEKQVASADENDQITRAEYRQGIATNLEVLISLNTLQQARLDRDRARFQLKLAGVRLMVQSGVLPGDAR